MSKTLISGLLLYIRALFIAIVILSASQEAFSQNLSMSTNIAEWADLGTINADMSYSVARHWSVGAGVQYNPFSYTGSSGNVFQDKEQSYSLGARFWPWHVYSGWFLSNRIRYQQFNSGGIVSERTSEGDRYGAGVSAGYAKMIGDHVNLEFGMGAWFGHEKYVSYACPVCGVVVDRGEKVFLLPDSLILSLAYIF